VETPADGPVRGAGGAAAFLRSVGVTTYNKSTQTSIPYAVPYQQSGAANYFSSFSQPYAPAALGWTPRWASATTTSEPERRSDRTQFTHSSDI